MGQSVNIDRLIRTIGSFWDEKIILPEETCFFLESTLGITTSQELADLLESNGAPDRDMMFEMVLFPGSDVRFAVEPLLGNQGLAPEQIRTVAGRLGAAYRKLTLMHPAAEASIRVKIPHYHVRLYLQRLFLNRSLDPDLCDALAETLSPTHCMNCRVLLRCKNYDMKAREKSTAIRFIRKASGREDVADMLDLLLATLAEATDTADPESSLLQRYFLEKRTLEAIHRFEKKRAHYSMEYLMMSRYPVPHESFEQVQKRIEKLDILLFDILCIPRLSQMEVSQMIRDLGVFDPKTDIGRLRQILS